MTIRNFNAASADIIERCSKTKAVLSLIEREAGIWMHTNNDKEQMFKHGLGRTYQ